MLKFILGEEKRIEMKITSRKKQVIVITNAEYSITNRDGALITGGQCEINGSEMSVLYTPDKVGVYMFEVTYTIPPERLKARCDLVVT